MMLLVVSLQGCGEGGGHSEWGGERRTLQDLVLRGSAAKQTVPGHPHCGSGIYTLTVTLSFLSYSPSLLYTHAPSLPSSFPSFVCQFPYCFTSKNHQRHFARTVSVFLTPQFPSSLPSLRSVQSATCNMHHAPIHTLTMPSYHHLPPKM